MSLMRSALKQAGNVGSAELMSAGGGLKETCRHEPPKGCALCKQCCDGGRSTGHEFVFGSARMMQADDGMIVLGEYEGTRASGRRRASVSQVLIAARCRDSAAGARNLQWFAGCMMQHEEPLAWKRSAKAQISKHVWLVS